jgi:hypothetical protein
LNYTFGAEKNNIEEPLLEKLMLHMTARESTVHINLTIPEKRDNSLFLTISEIYRKIYLHQRRSFGGIILTIRIVGLSNERMFVYNEHDSQSENNIAQLIKDIAGNDNATMDSGAAQMNGNNEASSSSTTFH